MRPDKIISGCQTGADQGALAAASALGIETGGFMPYGFLTEVGYCPDLARLYNMTEHRSPTYPPRTRQNVKIANGTVWIGAGNSRGQRCTYKAVEDYGKPYLNNPNAVILRQWTEQWGIHILNVAGPRASHDPDAFSRAFKLILEAYS